MLDHYSVPVHNNQQVAALPQLDRGSDYESERHRFESYTPHQLNFKASGNGGFSYIAMRRRSRQALQMIKNQIR